MANSMFLGCDVRKPFRNYIPIAARVCLAPFGFAFIFILILANVDFSSYAWSGYERTGFQHIVSVCMDTILSTVILVLIYLSILKLTKTYSKKDMIAGVIYLTVFHFFFLIFSLTDLVIILKNTVEYLLHHFGHWSNSEQLSSEEIEGQKNYRDISISVIYFFVNTLLSMLITAWSHCLCGSSLDNDKKGTFCQ